MSDLRRVCRELHKQIEAKDAEIERLHTDWRIQNDHIVKVNKEIERIGADLELSMNQCDWWVGELEAKEAEIERLRAALKRIVNENADIYCEDIALAALEDDDD